MRKLKWNEVVGLVSVASGIGCMIYGASILIGEKRASRYEEIRKERWENWREGFDDAWKYNEHYYNLYDRELKENTKLKAEINTLRQENSRLKGSE